jgi:MYXO-CTERM domain-containing protein
MRRSIVTLALLVLIAAPRSAEAFCGFYVEGSGKQLVNDATQVVLMRSGTRTVLSMQNHYAGPPEAFAMVVPVPVVLHDGDVKTLPRDVFDRIETLDAPRLVEYWEQDPCQPYPPKLRRKMTGAPPPPTPSSAPAGVEGGYVKVEAEFVAGEYQIVILSATDSTALDTWLREQHYAIPDGAEPLLRPYVEGGWKFFVAKVDPKKVTFDSDGRAELSPLRFHYDSDEFVLPVRLGLINSAGKQDLIVHILGDTRYELASYPNAFIPTNLEVTAAAKERFAELYAAVFDRTLEQHPRAVVTEYAWDARGCDPCPGPALDRRDLETLGGDVTNGASTVLTRLHARYGKDLAEDLVFRAASPVSGGREDYDAAHRIVAEPKASDSNTFQARYVIRHAWDGPINCTAPQRGIWGGPGRGSAGKPGGVSTAQDLAFAPRGKLALSSMIASGTMSLEIEKPTPPPAPAPAAVEDAPKKTSSGCGCSSSSPSAGLALALLVLVIRRRK